MLKEFITANIFPITGGILGLILAISILLFGFFKTLLVLFFISIGVVFGTLLKKSDFFNNYFQ